jgi:hypothetical protein
VHVFKAIREATIHGLLVSSRSNRNDPRAVRAAEHHPTLPTEKRPGTAQPQTLDHRHAPMHVRVATVISSVTKTAIEIATANLRRGGTGYAGAIYHRQ